MLAPLGERAAEPNAEEPPGRTDVNTASDAAASADRLENILWLARVVYSETKEPEEMRLVGWVVRNRVETGFRGTTYREVATRKKQFSGLNPGDPGAEEILALDYADERHRAWTTALAIAEEVYDADSASRPFPVTVRHFYSPHAVRAVPLWTDAGALHLTIEAADGTHSRFAFYNGVR
jgi:hypothetical protein